MSTDRERTIELHGRRTYRKRTGQDRYPWRSDTIDIAIRMTDTIETNLHIHTQRYHPSYRWSCSFSFSFFFISIPSPLNSLPLSLFSSLSLLDANVHWPLHQLKRCDTTRFSIVSIKNEQNQTLLPVRCGSPWNERTSSSIWSFASVISPTKRTEERKEEGKREEKRNQKMQSSLSPLSLFSLCVFLPGLLFIRLVFKGDQSIWTQLIPF